MVYLRHIIEQGINTITAANNLEQVAYLYIKSNRKLDIADFELSPEEEVAFNGYAGIFTESDVVRKIVTKTPVKGVGALSNVYKLLGLYLIDNSLLITNVGNRYSQSDYKQKYFITKFAPDLYLQLENEVRDSNETIACLIRFAMGMPIDESVLNVALSDIVGFDIDVQLIVLLEDVEKKLLQAKYINKGPDELIRQVLENFSNAIQKVATNRRQGHPEFQINDEYDVQDLLYVMLKPIFPNLKEEDPIPKVGAKSTKIDLIIREEKVLIEAKMIKAKDSSEREFIEQLKIDIESYHTCQWLKTLFCFVYDPLKKTRDVHNFSDLNGIRTKNGHTFSVEVIVAN